MKYVYTGWWPLLKIQYEYSIHPFSIALVLWARAEKSGCTLDWLPAICTFCNVVQPTSWKQVWMLILSDCARRLASDHSRVSRTSKSPARWPQWGQAVSKAGWSDGPHWTACLSPFPKHVCLLNWTLLSAHRCECVRSVGLDRLALRRVETFLWDFFWNVGRNRLFSCSFLFSHGRSCLYVPTCLNHVSPIVIYSELIIKSKCVCVCSCARSCQCYVWWVVTS